MKLFIATLLIISNQSVMAFCKRVDIVEYSYMNKEELIEEFCENRSVNKKFKDMNAGIDVIIPAWKDMVECTDVNSTNAFRVLRKDHGVKKQEDIKCE